MEKKILSSYVIALVIFILFLFLCWQFPIILFPGNAALIDKARDVFIKTYTIVALLFSLLLFPKNKKYFFISLVVSFLVFFPSFLNFFIHSIRRSTYLIPNFVVTAWAPLAITQSDRNKKGTSAQEQNRILLLFFLIMMGINILNPLSWILFSGPR